MPWSYPNNIPSVAKNWTPAQQKACVAAGNAVLKKGGTDKEAIFACIAAAGKSKKGDSLEELIGKRMTALAQAKAQRGKRRMPKPLIPPGTKTLELSYYRDLKAMVSVLKRLTRERVFPYLEAVSESAETARPTGDRMDDYQDDIEEIMANLRLVFYEHYSDEEIVNMAARAAERGETVNRRFYERMATQLKVASVRMEPWLAQEMTAFTKTNVKLIKSISEEHFARVEDIVTRGAQQGKLGKAVAAEVRGKFHVPENKARLIARDQVSKFNGQLHKLRQQELGIKRYRWQTAGDERVRTTHKLNDGKIFSWNKPPATGHPGEDIQCRCISIPVYE